MVKLYVYIYFTKEYVIFIPAWSRLGQAYRNATSSLQSTRQDGLSIKDEQRRLFQGKRPATMCPPKSVKRQKKVTWIHTFVCLASASRVYQSNVPIDR